MDREPLTITISEAMRLSSLGRSFLYTKLADGSIQSVKANKRRLIVYPSFKEWLALPYDPNLDGVAYVLKGINHPDGDWNCDKLNLFTPSKDSPTVHLAQT